MHIHFCPVYINKQLGTYIHRYLCTYLVENRRIFLKRNENFLKFLDSFEKSSPEPDVRLLLRRLHRQDLEPGRPQETETGANRAP
jgi:hypothetical protein